MFLNEGILSNQILFLHYGYYYPVASAAWLTIQNDNSVKLEILFA